MPLFEEWIFIFSQCLETLANCIGTVAIFGDLNFGPFFRDPTKFTNFLDAVGGISAMMMTMSRKVILLPYKWPEKKRSLWKWNDTVWKAPKKEALNAEKKCTGNCDSFEGNNPFLVDEVITQNGWKKLIELSPL